MNTQNKDPKVFEFLTKEDLIMYTSLILELAIRHMDRYNRYIKELEKFIVENDKFRYTDYKEIEDKLNTPQNHLLNLFGDNSKNAASYLRIRRIMKEKKEKFNIDYIEHDQDTREIHNHLYKTRNYEHHVTDSKIMEWGLYRKRQLVAMPYINWPTEEIKINYSEYLEKESVVHNYEAAKQMQDYFKKLLQLMKKDYSLLIGKSMKVSRVTHAVSNTNDLFQISENGQSRHLGKRKKM
ncbi:hypothetical protein [Paenibacillus silvae]|uniref:Uncharacterized protein n=1 Tax=Paenibacillus silvae TaxID=1325358 RepID=A0A2W6P174_9BACL|nr:hypothetical protein [Paenibacillus silvae]PZT51916.1 hypothetical protein DN757_30175 [Paenibacillus silvae]